MATPQWALAKALGANTIVRFLDVPRDELVRRLVVRNENPPPGTFRIDEQYLDLWSTWFERPTEDELFEQ